MSVVARDHDRAALGPADLAGALWFPHRLEVYALFQCVMGGAWLWTRSCVRIFTSSECGLVTREASPSVTAARSGGSCQARFEMNAYPMPRAQSERGTPP